MNEQDKLHLQSLRNSVLDELSGMVDYFTNSDDISYEVLLALARNTGNSALLDKTFEKIKAIEDPEQKSDALLSLLDEVEMSLADDLEDDDIELTDQEPTTDTALDQPIEQQPTGNNDQSF